MASGFGKFAGQRQSVRLRQFEESDLAYDGGRFESFLAFAVPLSIKSNSNPKLFGGSSFSGACGFALSRQSQMVFKGPGDSRAAPENPRAAKKTPDSNPILEALQAFQRPGANKEASQSCGARPGRFAADGHGSHCNYT
jgi:hypothetical protein